VGVKGGAETFGQPPLHFKRLRKICPERRPTKGQIDRHEDRRLEMKKEKGEEANQGLISPLPIVTGQTGYY